MNNSELAGATNLDPWGLPQQKIDIKSYTPLYKLDEVELATLHDWLNGEQVEIFYDLNDDTDYAVQHIRDGRLAIAKISECVTINGVRWHLVPGKNTIPKAVYEFIKQCPEQRKRVSCPTPNRAENYGDYRK